MKTLHMSICSLGLLILSTSALAASKGTQLPPTAFIPAGAPAVIEIKNPSVTLERIEKFAIAAGLLTAQEDQANGLRARLFQTLPIAKQLNFGKPIWIALGESSQANQPPDAIFITQLEGTKLEPTQEMKELEFKTHGQWLVAVPKNSKFTAAKVYEQHYETPKNLAAELTQRSDLIIYTDIENIDKVFRNQNIEDVTAITSIYSLSATGVSLARSGGVEVLSQLFPTPGKFKTVMAEVGQANAKMQHKAPLISGLPTEDYLFVSGTRSDPRTWTAWSEQISNMLEKLVAQSDVKNQQRQKLNKSLPLLKSMLKDISKGECSQSSAGITMPSGWDSVSFSLSNRCANAESWIKALIENSSQINELFAQLSKNPKQPEIEWVTEKVSPKSSMYKTQLKVKNDNGNLSQIGQTPLILGTVSKSQGITSFNLSEKAQKSLEAAAQKNIVTDISKYQSVQKYLLDQRTTEVYLKPWSAVAAALPKQLKVLGPMLSLLPPLGASQRTEADGSSLIQVWVPEKMVQIGVMMGATLQ